MRKEQCFLIAYTLPCTPIPVVKTATSSAGSKSMIFETLTDLDASAHLSVWTLPDAKIYESSSISTM